MTGNIRSIQSLGAVDGPGVRYVVFMQGCPLRCIYCHNPDTWQTGGGTPTDLDELVRKALRFRPYWKNGGGVTVTGGEPLMQAEFVAEFFAKLHEHGVHTALDTSGAGSLAQAKRVLEHTDLVLCDLKFLTRADYFKNCRADFDQIKRFLQLTATKNVPLWIRHVVIPGLTDSLDNLRRVKAAAESYPNIEKLEFLPFHKLCIEKYERLGLEFPLKDTPAMHPDTLKNLLLQLQRDTPEPKRSGRPCKASHGGDCGQRTENLPTLAVGSVNEVIQENCSSRRNFCKQGGNKVNQTILRKKKTCDKIKL